ncbi:AAA family ATPase [Psychroflexus aestuariivivens]|uniref:AAA family ATPase n=1 Tax=Psychroflexus aestuariivivens TaxID=1795040 RepID=UPI000FD89A08|nr:AAA family ATPase [Psychroflexus aestuariivivens]
MNVTVSPHKIIPEEYNLDLSNSKVKLLIGGNGSGKSSILESIFKTPQDVPKRIVCYSSGQNESFSKIYKKFQKENKVYTLEPDEDNTNDEIIDSKFKNTYFNYTYSRLLIFFAISLKSESNIRSYLNHLNLSSLKLKIDFRLPKNYVDRINGIIEREALRPELRTIRNTFFHRYLQIFIDRFIRKDYDFENSIEKQVVELSSDDIPIDYTNVTRLFAFLSWAESNQFIDISSAEIVIDGYELDSYSDGEFQLMSIYSIIDLFDEEETLFLFDEIDSHIHYDNIKLIWEMIEHIKGKLVTTTHSADSIILNKISNIRLVQKGQFQEEILADRILKRLESLSAGGNYKLKVAGKVPFIALVEDYFDWFIFFELCKRKITDFDSIIINKIQYIKCSSGFDNTSERFGNSKLDWIESFKQQNKSPRTKAIFLICDRDNLPIQDVKNSGLVRNSINSGRKNTINLPGNGNRAAYLMSWKRREIENYLLSYTMLNNHGKLEEINNNIASVDHLAKGNPGDNNGVRNLDTKSMLQPLYLKDGIKKAISYDESGVDYNKLKDLIAEIPVNEISEDIINIYNFIKGKL